VGLRKASVAFQAKANAFVVPSHGRQVVIGDARKVQSAVKAVTPCLSTDKKVGSLAERRLEAFATWPKGGCSGRVPDSPPSGQLSGEWAS